MNIKSSYRALLTYVISFLLFGAIIWALNVIIQSIFPGNHLFPILIRFLLLVGILTLTYYVNIKLTRKSGLDAAILKFRWQSIKQYLFGFLLGVLVIATIWTIIYVVYPFEIIKNTYSKSNLVIAIVSYSLGNTLEELLFRGFLLLAAVRLFGKINGILLVSLLFGLFHLQGIGVTKEGLNMVITTFAMSLLLISVLFYSKSLWAAVILHITGNLLLHAIGFDVGKEGMFQIRFVKDSNVLLLTLIYIIVVCAFAFFLFSQVEKKVIV